MKPCESIIVTVELSGKFFDVELPAFISIAELNKSLEETFRILRPNYVGYGNEMSICFHGERLSSERNLASYGIWDGAELKLLVESR